MKVQRFYHFGLAIAIVFTAIAFALIACDKKEFSLNEPDIPVQLEPVPTPIPCTFNKQDHSDLQWERISYQTDFTVIKMIKSSQDHLFMRDRKFIINSCDRTYVIAPDGIYKLLE